MEEIEKKYKENLGCLIVGCCGTEPTVDYDEVWEMVKKISQEYFQKRLKEILPEKVSLEDELSEAEKEVMIKLFGDYKTPEHMRERRYGYNNCIEEILNNNK